MIFFKFILMFFEEIIKVSHIIQITPVKQNPAPDKAQNQLMWVQHMNSLKAQADRKSVV